MLEKKIYVDQVEVIANDFVQVRTRTAILEDGVELSSSLHRHVVAPGECTDIEAPKVQAICAAVHTPDVVAAYQAEQARIAAEREAQRLAAEQEIQRLAAEQALAQESQIPA